MQDSAKYLIHADFRANGVVERSDVVGAIFGQTEGLLGEELDLRDLQESSKVGRIEVELSTDAGRSFGTVTIASGLDRVETAVLAAGLETIERIGPCRAEFEVGDLEDARAAKRREIVDRATDLLATLEESTLTSHELVEEVRQNVRVEDITTYEGYPAGPRVADTDAIIVVEGRSDVLQLLRHGIKTAIAVEGTDVPDEIADLTRHRTVTAFLDGDRGGDLILRELAQVGAVDYVAFAPAGRSVEDLDRDEVLSALRRKVAYEEIEDASSPREAVGADAIPAGHAGDRSSQQEGESGDSAGETTSPTDADGSAGSRPNADRSDDDRADDGRLDDPQGDSQSDDAGPSHDSQPDDAGQPHDSQPDDASPPGDSEGTAVAEDSDTPDGEGTTDPRQVEEPSGEEAAADEEPAGPDTDGDATEDPVTLADHVESVIRGKSGRVRLLDADFDVVSEGPAESAFEAIETAEQGTHTVVLDGELSQRVLDVAAQRNVPQVVARSEGEFVKQPTSVRVRNAEAF